MAPKKLLVFGPPRLEYDGPELGLRKALALLVYLAVTDQPHSRDVLATLFWPSSDQRKARTHLRRVLHRLNQALGGRVLESGRDTIGLHPHADLWLDSAAFQKHAAAGLLAFEADQGPNTVALAELTQAARLYTDDFLAGFTLPDSPAWDEWQFFQYESLRRTCAQVLERLVQAQQSQGGFEEAISYARRWVALDPLHEPAHRALMRLYAWTGQQTAALRQYWECVRLLDVELGASPEVETVALFEAVRTRKLEAPVAAFQESSLPVAGSEAAPRADAARDSDRAAQPAHNLPSPPTPFVGREQELATLRDLLDDPACRLVTVVGPGGMGKTRLALAGASAIRDAFRHGVYFVPLASLTTADHLVSALAEHLGFQFYPGGSPKQQLLDYLREKEILLVLDNYEHLLEGAGFVMEMLLSAPQVKFIVTSREPLNLSGEVVYSLGGMAFPETSKTEDVLAYGAVQLLIQQARLVRPDLDLRAYDLDAMVRICQLVEGMPLAIVLAAGWLKVLSFRAIADEIAQSLDFLEGSMRDVPARQRSIRATFDYSWKRLAAKEQRAFMKLSVFHGGFTREAAKAVAGADLRILRSLVNHSFVSIDPEGRYGIHELLRQYAAEYLEEMDDVVATRDAHCMYYLNEMDHLQVDLKGRRQLEAMDEVEADLENIRASWHWALHQCNREAIDRALESIYLFFTMRSRYQEGAELFQRAREVLAPHTREEAARVWRRVLSRLAFFHMLSSAVREETEADLESSLRLAEQDDDRAEIAFSLLILGCYHYLITHDYSRALDLFEQSLNQYKALGDSFYIVAALHWLGECHGSATNLEHFYAYTQQGLELAEEAGNIFGVALNLSNLITIALCLGDYGGAERYSRQAYATHRKLDLRLGMAEAQSRLSLLYLLQGNLEEARPLAEGSLRTARDIHYSVLIAEELAILGIQAGLRADYQLGRQLGEESLANPANFFETILAHWGLAIAYCGLQDFEMAWTHLQTVLKQASSRGFTGILFWTLPVAAVILVSHGQPEYAMALLVLASTHPLHPKGWMERWPLLSTLRADLAATLGPDRYKVARGQGTELKLENVVALLLSVPWKALDNQPAA